MQGCTIFAGEDELFGDEGTEVTPSKKIKKEFDVIFSRKLILQSRFQLFITPTPVGLTPLFKDAFQ